MRAIALAELMATSTGCGLGRAENLVAVDKEEALMKNMLPTWGLLSRKKITLRASAGGLSGLAIEWLPRR